MNQMQSQMAEYDAALQEMRKLELKHAESMDKLNRFVEVILHLVHSLFIIDCYTKNILREQLLFILLFTHIDKFFHNSLGAERYRGTPHCKIILKNTVSVNITDTAPAATRAII